MIVALHGASHKRLPVVLFGAGLPSLAGLAGDAKSYAERLFRYPAIDKLPVGAATEAIEEPLRSNGVSITKSAVVAIIEATEGYPYFLQEWGITCSAGHAGHRAR